jgi:hypothetical protein
VNALKQDEEDENVPVVVEDVSVATITVLDQEKEGENAMIGVKKQFHQ